MKLAEENAGCQYARSGHHNGGGGLWSTAEDFCKILHGTIFPKNEQSAILSQASIEQLFTPCLSTSKYLEATVARMRSETHYTPGGLDLLPQIPTSSPKNFGLGVVINLEYLETGMAAGSIQWSGFANCYWVSLQALEQCNAVLEPNRLQWVDRKNGVVGILLSSLLMFADPLVLKVLKRFQEETYKKLRSRV